MRLGQHIPNFFGGVAGVGMVVATETAIKRSIDRLYDSADSLASVMKDIEDDFEIGEEEEEEDNNPKGAMALCSNPNTSSAFSGF